MNLAANNTDNPLGRISTGGPLDGLEPTVALGKLFTVGLQLLFVVVGVMLLIYMLWGGLKWITSSGEPEALEKARARIIHALVGGLIIIAVIAIFGLIAGNIIGLIKYVPGVGFQFRIPTIEDQINNKDNNKPKCTEECIPKSECTRRSGIEERGFSCGDDSTKICCKLTI